MFPGGESIAKRALRIAAIATLLSVFQAPALAQEATESLPQFAVVRSEHGIGIFAKLQSGPLLRVGEKYQPPTGSKVHLVQEPFDPFQNPDGYRKEFLNLFSLFRESPPLDPRRLRLQVPSSEQSRKEAASLGLDGFEELYRKTAQNDCAETDSATKSLNLLCLLQAIRNRPADFAAVPVELTAGRSAAIVFERKDIGPKVISFRSCVRQRETGDDCPRIPALLLHDMVSLDRLAPKLGSTLDTSAILALEESGLFDVVDFQHPESLLAEMMTARNLPGDHDALMYRMVLMGGAWETRTPPPPAREFAEEVLISYSGGFEGSDTKTLLLPLGDAEAAAGIAGDGVLSKAFLPRKDRSVQALAVPSWLYDRLASVSLAAQAEPGHFCREGNLNGPVLLASSRFSRQFGAADAIRVDEKLAPNASRTRLYSSACADDVSIDETAVVVWPDRFSSSEFGGVCGSERDGLEKVSGVAGSYNLSPVIDAPASWVGAAPFVLSSIEEGVYVQSRPVNLGEFADHLTTFSGCRSFVQSGGFAASFATCGAQGNLRIRPQGGDAGKTPLKLNEFHYFYGAVGAAIQEATGQEQPGLTCHNRRTTSRSEPQAAQTAEALCALRFFFAARAVDRLDGQEPEQNNTLEDPEDEDTDRSLAEKVLREGIGPRGDVSEANAGQLMEFEGCGGQVAAKLPVNARPLCTALQRYVRAAFGKITGLPWSEAPVTMVSSNDVDTYSEWRAGEGFGSDPAQARMSEVCKTQLDIPRMSDLIQASSGETEISRDLVPDMQGLLQSEGLSQGIFSAGVLASTRPVLMAGRSDVGIAGLPVGFRQHTQEGGVANVPDFGNGEHLERGFGLSPRGVITYFQQIENYGECFECINSETAFWWRTWNDKALDDPKKSNGEASGRGGDPVTGFRLILKLKK